MKTVSEHIFYAFSCRVIKLGVVVHHGMVQRRALLLDQGDLLLDLNRTSNENCVQSISFMLLHADSPNLVW